MNRWRSPGRGLACRCIASRPTSRHSSRSTSYPRTPWPPTRSLRTLLEVCPWSGEPSNETNPDAEVRTLTFGAHHEGMVTYLILDGQRRVDVLSVLWLG
jgi:hypothetical protein